LGICTSATSQTTFDALTSHPRPAMLTEQEARNEMPDHSYFENLIWQIADLLRGPYRPPQYERVTLPLTVLRRFDSVLAPTKAEVLAEYDKRKDTKHGSRMAVVLSGSPLFTGGAGSGESEIRKRITENDWLEAIVALPEQMFYNTGIGTYVWIVTNRKEPRRKGKVQLLDARDWWVPMRKRLGDKRRKLGEGPGSGGAGEPDQIAEIVQLYGNFTEGPRCKIFDNEDLGYTRITVERPLRLRYQMTTEDKARFLDACPHLLDDIQAIDQALGREPLLDWNDAWTRITKLLRKRDSKWKAPEQKLFQSVFTVTDPDAEPVSASKGKGFEADSGLRDTENVPLELDVDAYFEAEVKPHVPDAWMDRSKDRVGYEINFNRYFYVYTPPRELAEIDADLKRAEDEILRLSQEVTT
jgi:type I restriction enzyme M protein